MILSEGSTQKSINPFQKEKSSIGRLSKWIQIPVEIYCLKYIHVNLL